MDNDLDSATESSRRLFWGYFQTPGIKRALNIVGVLIIAFIAVFLYQLLFPAAVPPSQYEINESINQALAFATPGPAYSSVVYQTILPSIVFIQIEGVNEDNLEGHGLGSGVIINKEGDILTALHVVANAKKIEVHFSDGSRSSAEIIGAEPEIDLAVLHPQQPPALIVPAVLGSTSALRVGDEAFAVGNPLGLVASMSAGVISGFNRSIPADNDNLQLDGLIQFDTAVNPGSSGGPLLNRNGQVIGIVTALANPSDQNFFVGIGFAVPIGSAVTVAGFPDY